jgi:3-deoxy-7-phosphoheptulonate synthase
VIVKVKQQASAEAVEGIKILLEENLVSFRYFEIYQVKAFVITSKANEKVMEILKMMESVGEIVEGGKEYPLASRALKEKSTSFCVNNVEVGGSSINIVAGPCSVESEEQIFGIAEFVSNLGIKFIRGGAYKPRTSPYRFQGLGNDGLKLIRKAADTYGLLVVTEVLDTSLLDETCPYADILQVGSRNMQNFHFLKQLGKVNKPVLLKRGMNVPVEEWLMAAEYILTEGNEKVILCERGIKSFDNLMRNTMDIAAIPLVKILSHLPIWADPSHGTGRRDLVEPVSLAAIAAGADGLVLEVHPEPEKALSDGPQSLYLDQFSRLVRHLQPLARALNRKLDTEITKQPENLNLCVE